MFLRNLADIFIKPDKVIYVNGKDKAYLQSKGFMPIGRKDGLWVFAKTETLLNIISEKGGKENNA